MRIDRTRYEAEAWASASWPAEGSSWPTLGWAVADWIESRLVHGPGDVERQPIRLSDQQLVFLAHAYRLRPDTGRRVVKNAVLSRPKGWAKSEFASWITAAEAFAPVRFSHWDEAGAPAARSVNSPQIRLMATEEGQVGNTFDCLTEALEYGAIADEWGLRKSREIQEDRIVIPTGGEIEVSTSAPSGKDGGRDVFGVGDEIHLWLLERLKRMGRTISRNMVKRPLSQAWFLFTTTCFSPGEQSYAEEIWEEVEAAGGVAPFFDEKSGLLFDHCEAGPLSEEELENDDLVLEHLARAYGSRDHWMVNLDTVGEMRRGSIADANRYFLNAVVAGESAYMDVKAYDAASINESLQLGDEVTLGFDGSRSDDSTALVACRVSDGLLWPVKIWNRDTSVDVWRVDQGDVQATVDAAREDFNVVAFYCDPAYWWQEVAAWNREYGGIVREWYIQGPGRRRPVHEMLEAFRMAIEERQVRPSLAAPQAVDLRRHVGNAVRENHVLGYGIRKPKQELKIDACIAAGLAAEARRDHIQASQTPTTYAVGSWNY